MGKLQSDGFYDAPTQYRVYSAKVTLESVHQSENKTDIKHNIGMYVNSEILLIYHIFDTCSF